MMTYPCPPRSESRGGGSRPRVKHIIIIIIIIVSSRDDNHFLRENCLVQDLHQARKWCHNGSLTG